MHNRPAVGLCARRSPQVSAAKQRLPRCSHYSHDRGAKHPENHLADYSGIMRADAYSGYNGLYAEGRKPGPIFEAAVGHRAAQVFELADLQKAPIACDQFIELQFQLIRNRAPFSDFRNRQFQLCNLAVKIERTASATISSAFKAAISFGRVAGSSAIPAVYTLRAIPRPGAECFCGARSIPSSV